MGILNVIVVLLLLFWLGGFAFHIAGGLINILLIAAVVIFALRFFRRSTV